MENIKKYEFDESDPKSLISEKIELLKKIPLSEKFKEYSEDYKYKYTKGIEAYLKYLKNNIYALNNEDKRFLKLFILMASSIRIYFCYNICYKRSLSLPYFRLRFFELFSYLIFPMLIALERSVIFHYDSKVLSSITTYYNISNPI